jgi:ubiquinone/menaquinone biosynthesis C-methylase UbiE
MTLLFTRILWWFYGWTYDGLRSFYPYQNLIENVASVVAGRPHERILDLGCGTGNLMVELLRREPSLNLSGIDLSPTMTARARGKLRRSHVTLATGDLLAYLATCGNETFDAVASVNVIYALPDRTLLWRELRRVLKPNGRLIIATATRTGSGSIIAEHLAHAPRYKLLMPRLIGVGIVDLIIDHFGSRGTFPFPSEATLKEELSAVDFTTGPVTILYGGVDILFASMKNK